MNMVPDDNLNTQMMKLAIVEPSLDIDNHAFEFRDFYYKKPSFRLKSTPDDTTYPGSPASL